MLLRQIERIRRARRIDHFLVATSRETTDDPIESLCGANGITCTRGSLEDVLDRFYQAAQPLQPEHVVRLTGDCPLTDPVVIDQVIEFYLSGDYEYATNALEPTFPDGLDVEVFRFSCLQQAWKEAKLPSHREHVTPFLHKHPGRFKIGHFKSATDLSHLRWTVDEPADFTLVSQIYEELYPQNPAFTSQHILAFLDEHPHLKSMNTHHTRNEGAQKSQREDLLYMKRNGAIS